MPWLVRWEEAARAAATPVPAWTIVGNAAPRWSRAYAAVTLPDTPSELRATLDEEGTTCFAFPADTGRWPELFVRLHRYLENAQ